MQQYSTVVTIQVYNTSTCTCTCSLHYSTVVTVQSDNTIVQVHCVHVHVVYITVL